MLSTALLLLSSSALATDMPRVRVGEPVPAFEVTTAEGRRVTPATLKGKRALIFMWASW